MRIGLFSLAWALACTADAGATVINVNNSTPGPGQYASLQSAIDNATAGDTLYIAGTGITYGAVTLNKQLSFIGPGVILEEGGYSGSAQMGVISLSSLSASGSKFIGIRFFQINSVDAGVSIFTGLTIQRCIVDDCLFLGNDDWTSSMVEGNLFTSSGPNVTGNNSAANLNYSTIRNNVFNGTMYYVVGNLIQNNLFCGMASGNMNIFSSSASNTIQNNIAVGRNCSAIDVNSACTANISFSCLSPNFPGAGNFPNTNPMFVNYSPSVFSWAHDFHLQEGSPALGTGTDGMDIGIYGGNGIYRKDLEPNIPVVREFIISGGNSHPSNSTITISVTGVTHE